MVAEITQKVDLPRSTDLGCLATPDHFWHPDLGLCLKVEQDSGDPVVFVYQQKGRGELVTMKPSTTVFACDVKMEFKLKDAKSYD